MQALEDQFLRANEEQSAIPEGIPYRSGTPSQRVSSWQRAYAFKLFLTDVLIVVLCAFGAQLTRFGDTAMFLEASLTDVLGFRVGYTFLSIGLVGTWLLALKFDGAWDRRVVGNGSAEYVTVMRATLGTFGALAIAAFLLRMQVARGYMVIALPCGIVLLLLGRWFWRQWLRGQRKAGRNLHRAVVVGDRAKTGHVIQQIADASDSGYQIVGEVTTSNGGSVDCLRPLPDSVYRAVGYDEILPLIDRTGSDTLILTSSDVLTPERTRQLGWQLDKRDIELVVAPALTDIAGPRIHTRPVAGLPLLHISYPSMSGTRQVVKRAFDVLGSLALIVIFSPVLAIVALAVKLTSPGPLLFKHERIGLNGEPFKMLKFRSMVVDADRQLKSLLEQQGTGDRPLFKVTNDPRITPIGRFLRKYSLDELPQLFNVLNGSMSLVGPRPQVAGEVALYGEWDGRRLLVKPGITGLWQVSGRSNLEWEDAIRLDLYYVENWSLMNDLMILFRTVRAVAMPDGAY